MKKLLALIALLPSLCFGGTHIQQGQPVTTSSLTITGTGIRFSDNSVQTTAATGGGSSTTTVKVNGTTLLSAATSFNFVNGSNFTFTGSTPTANSITITGTASASGGSGIVSPGTFTWVNQQGLNISTLSVAGVTASTVTVSSLTATSANITTINNTTLNTTQITNTGTLPFTFNGGGGASTFQFTSASSGFNAYDQITTASTLQLRSSNGRFGSVGNFYGSAKGWTIEEFSTSQDVGLSITNVNTNSVNRFINFESIDGSDVNGGNFWYLPSQRTFGLDRALNTKSTLIVGSTQTTNAALTYPQSTQFQVIGSTTNTYSLRVGTFTTSTDLAVSTRGVTFVKSIQWPDGSVQVSSPPAAGAGTNILPTTNTFTGGNTFNSWTVQVGSAVFQGDIYSTGSGNGGIELTISGSTYSVVSTSVTPIVGNFVVFTSTNGTTGNGGTGGGGGSGTVSSGSAGQLAYYASAGTTVSGAPRAIVTSSSITYTSTITINTGGGSPADNTNPALLNVFDGLGSYAGKYLFNVGSSNHEGQLYVVDGSPVYMNYGSTQKCVNVATVADDKISSCQSSNNQIDMFNGGGVSGQLSIQTSAAVNRDIVLYPQTVETIHISSNSTTILSSVTVRNTNGLVVTGPSSMQLVSASTVTASSMTASTQITSPLYAVTGATGLLQPVNGGIGIFNSSASDFVFNMSGGGYVKTAATSAFGQVAGDGLSFLVIKSSNNNVASGANIYTWARQDGSANQCLATDGSKNLSFITPLVNSTNTWTATQNHSAAVVISSTSYVQSLTMGTSSYASYGSSGTITPNAQLGNNISIVLTSSATINIPTNANDFQMFRYRIKQDALGSRTVILGSGFQFGVDVSTWLASTAANKVDYLGCIYNSSSGKCDVISSSLRGY